jgi:hypothetical protein
MGRTSLLFVAASLVICGFVQSSDAQNATGTNTPSKDTTGGAGNPQDPAAAIADQKAEAAMTAPTDVQPTPFPIFKGTNPYPTPAKGQSR